jgi:hypothetical protein
LQTLEAASLTVANIHLFAQYKEAEKAYKEPTEAMKLKVQIVLLTLLMNGLNMWSSTMTKTVAHCCISFKMMWYTRGMDPAFGLADTINGSICDEIAARAEHGTSQFQVDKSDVFKLLNDDFGSHSTMVAMSLKQ